MADPYVAVRLDRDAFVREYPGARGEPVGQAGFAAFGLAPIDLSEKLSRPDFDDVQLFLVLVRDADVFVAVAPSGDAVGYPPEYIKLHVADVGEDSGLVRLRKHIKSTSGDV